jgi:hypothetical protein
VKNAVYKIRIRCREPEYVLPKAVVVWSLLEKHCAEEHPEAYYESGLQFIELNENSRKALKKIMDNLAAHPVLG